MTQRISDDEVTALANSVSDPIIVGRLARDLFDLRAEIAKLRAVAVAAKELYDYPADHDSEGFGFWRDLGAALDALSTGKPE